MWIRTGYHPNIKVTIKLRNKLYTKKNIIKIKSSFPINKNFAAITNVRMEKLSMIKTKQL